MRNAAFTGLLAITFSAGAGWAQEADEALARHLASACASCHLIGEPTQGIPDIHGMEPATLITIFNEYREGVRQHRLMNTIASRYTDEELAVLGDYLAGVEGRQ